MIITKVKLTLYQHTSAV